MINIARWLDQFELGYLRELGATIDASAKIDSTVLWAGDLSNVRIGFMCRIDAFVSIVASGPFVMEDFCHISSHCSLHCAAGLYLNSFSSLSASVTVFTDSNDYIAPMLTNPTVPQHLASSIKGKVVLRRHVIVGMGSSIMPGVKIAIGSAIAAGAVVTKSTQPWMIYGGVPAKAIKVRPVIPLTLEAEAYEENSYHGRG